MASASMTTLLKPSLRKISAGAFAFPVTRTSATSIWPAEPKRKSHACFATVPAPLRSSLGNLRTCEMEKFGGRRGGTAGRSSSSIRSSRIDIVTSTETLRWLFAVSSVVLMLSKNTSIHKSFLVPLLALQAPGDAVSWIRGEYGLWTAFVIFLVRLFYPIPGEMELPLLFVLTVIIAPYQALNLRGTQAGMVISIAIAAYLSYQHITRSGGLKGAFEQRNLVASIAALCLICVPIWFLIQGFIF